MVATSFAQVQTPAGFAKNANKVPTMKPIYDQQQRDMFGWLSYSDYLYTNVGHQVTSEDYTFNYFQSDTIGTVYRADTAYMNPWIHGLGMTYDFTHDLYQNVAEEGEVSLAFSPVLKLDSVAIFGAYFRGDNTPAGCVDTLVVSVLTTLSDDNVMGGGYYDENHEFHANFRFHNIEYDYNTLMPANATLYKLPLTANDVSWDSAGYFRFSEYNLPINQGNITNKILNVSYMFKRGYNYNVEENIDNHSHFFARAWTDYRQAYYPYYNYDATHQADWQTCQNDFANNHNKGYYIDTDTRYDRTEQGYVGYRAYTPTFYLSKIHYPDLYLLLSCTDCLYTSVEDMEKENISVYPNPVDNLLKIKLVGDKEANIQLFNLVGQQVYNGKAVNNAEINVSNMKAGVYMLKVSQNGKVYTSKVVVK